MDLRFLQTLKPGHFILDLQYQYAYIHIPHALKLAGYQQDMTIKLDKNN